MFLKVGDGHPAACSSLLWLGCRALRITAILPSGRDRTFKDPAIASLEYALQPHLQDSQPSHATENDSWLACSLTGGLGFALALISYFCQLGYLECDMPSMALTVAAIALAATVIESLPLDRWGMQAPVCVCIRGKVGAGAQELLVYM